MDVQHFRVKGVWAFVMHVTQARPDVRAKEGKLNIVFCNLPAVLTLTQPRNDLQAVLISDFITRTVSVTNSIERSPSLKTACCSASRKFPTFLSNPEVQYRVHKSIYPYPGADEFNSKNIQLFL